MMPSVTVWPTPKGLPIASTTSPTCAWSDWPNRIDGSFGRSILSTARSVSGSVPDDARLGAPRVGERDFDLVGGFDDVAVGEDVALLAHDDARAQVRALARLRVELLAEEVAENRVVHERMPLDLHLLRRCRCSRRRASRAWRASLNEEIFSSHASGGASRIGDDAAARSPREQIGTQRGHDEQHRDAHRRGLTEHEPELADHRGRECGAGSALPLEWFFRQDSLRRCNAQSWTPTSTSTWKSPGSAIIAQTACRWKAAPSSRASSPA